MMIIRLVVLSNDSNVSNGDNNDNTVSNDMSSSVIEEVNGDEDDNDVITLLWKQVKPQDMLPADSLFDSHTETTYDSDGLAPIPPLDDDELNYKPLTKQEVLYKEIDHQLQVARFLDDSDVSYIDSIEPYDNDDTIDDNDDVATIRETINLASSQQSSSFFTCCLTDFVEPNQICRLPLLL